MNSQFHPFVPILVVSGILMALVVICSFVLSHVVARKYALAGLGVFFAMTAGYGILITHPEVADGRYRTFKTFYLELHEGMTREEVDLTLDRCYPKGGPRPRPRIFKETAEDLGFFMNPEHATGPNCEGIFLTLKSGRVTRKEYSAD